MSETNVTAYDLKQKLGPMAAPLAEKAGWSHAAWDVAVHHRQALTRDQMSAYCNRLAELIAEFRSLHDTIAEQLHAT